MSETEQLKADLAKLEAQVANETGSWIKTHIAWTIGLGCLLLGFIMGHLL